MPENRAALALATSRCAATLRAASAARIMNRRELALLCVVLCFNLCACRSGDKFPDKSSQKYSEAVSAFYVGLGALQVGDDIHAESKLSEFTTLVPGEPAGWANWGVLALRQRKLDVAAQRLERARSLAPKNDQIYQLLGYMESSRGNSVAAIADWRKAVELNPANYRAAYQLAEEVERQGGANGDAEHSNLIQKILAAQPGNLAAQLELLRVAAKTGGTFTSLTPDVDNGNYAYGNLLDDGTYLYWVVSNSTYSLERYTLATANLATLASGFTETRSPSPPPSGDSGSSFSASPRRSGSPPSPSTGSWGPSSGPRSPASFPSPC